MTDTPIRRCTVTVSGERGCGKSTLIAILAQALEGAGHAVSKPDHIKSAAQAISDLHHKFNVRFVEAADGESVTLTLDVDNAPVAEALKQAQQQIAACHADMQRVSADNTEKTRLLSQANRVNAELQSRLDDATSRLALLESASPPLLAPGDADRLITRVISYVRDAALMERQREDLHRSAEDLKNQSRKLRDESEARVREAEALLTQALTGRRPTPITPAQVQVERRAAASRLSAEEKLALANGADPAHLGGSLKVHVEAADATLASAIARDLAPTEED